MLMLNLGTPINLNVLIYLILSEKLMIQLEETTQLWLNQLRIVCAKTCVTYDKDNEDLEK